ncbi:MAG: hypothetical protein K6F09_06750, partial [Clostridiales bacterium]|nr:hypothetical protein [Clostridiales bacterium]
KSKLGEAIEIFPGKSESWLMLGFEDNCKMYFNGNDNADSAFIEVKIFGKANKSDCDKMTEKICEIIGDELNISPARIYVKYEECDLWGWNGRNF